MRLSMTIAAQVILVSQLAHSQSAGSVNVVSTSIVQFIVSDPVGRRTGADPRGALNPLSGLRIEEIPGALYSTLTPGDSPNDTSGIISDDDLMFEFTYPIKALDNDGVYKIEAIGIARGIYTLFIDIAPRRHSTLQPYSGKVSGIIDSMQSNVYEIDYHSTRGIPIMFRKLVSSNTIRQDILVSFANTWLGDRSLYDDLNQRLDSFESFLSQRDSVRGRNVLQGLQTRINAAAQQSGSSFFITLDSYQILSRDVASLLNQLPLGPVVASLTPSSTIGGGSGFVMNVKGKGFVSASVVVWNGSSRSTSCVEDSLLQTTILAGDVASPGTVRVAVVNPGNDTSNVLPFTIKPPLPVLSALAPATAIVGSGTFALRVSGSYFVSGAVIMWNGSARSATFVSGSVLTTSIPASDIAALGTASVTVVNPGNDMSNALTFTIKPPPPFITGLAPSTAIVNSGAFTLSVSGSSFLSGAVILWNGFPRATTFVSASTLTAPISSTDIAAIGSVKVSVVNPGNETSNIALFTVKPPPPSISSLTPAKIQVGSAAFALTIDGSNFVNGAKVIWYNAERGTTFKSPKQLAAQIPSTDVAKVDSPLVTVKNPDGSVSNAIRFKVFKTVAMLLSDLRTSLAQSLKKGLIGDANFVKELDNGLDNAQKHLAKPDSANCYKEVSSFQDKVNKEYLKTADNDKKGVPRDKRFVTKDGWTLLYFAAQEIMDRLPSKK